MSSLLMAHIAGGSLGFLTGTVALFAAKGEPVHRAAGKAFFLAMLLMVSTAAILSIARQPGTIVSSFFTLYLIATAWVTVRRGEKRVGSFDYALTALGLGCVAGEVFQTYMAATSPSGHFLGYPTPVHAFLLAIVTLAVAFDLKVILTGGIAGAARVARHVWRTCLAFFFAAASSLTQLEKVLPVQVGGTRLLPLLIGLALAPLVLMLFWMVRVRFTGWYRTTASA